MDRPPQKRNVADLSVGASIVIVATDKESMK